ncbi:MAG: DNA repair protein RecN [Bacillota bacterium]|nr:DNA repair protein RecN [Bacillota bacterium]
MLDHLLIRNIALFEEAGIQFGTGLHVLTGETGAGKSLVVDAVNFLCGAKADKDLIRVGAEKAYVEGIFNIQGLSAVKDQLNTMQMLEEDEDQLILSREMSIKGRSVFRVNGLAVTGAVYQELTAKLIDIHGQHEHQSLLNDQAHLNFLDLLGDSAHEELRLLTREAFLLYSQHKKSLQAAQKSSLERNERFDVLEMRRRELSAAKLKPGEEEELQQEKNMLRNADKMIQAIEGVCNALTESDGEETVLSLIRQSDQLLERIKDFHPDFPSFQARLDSVYYEIEEIGRELSAYLREINADESRLEEVETRLDLLRKLQRKYGPTTEAMLKTLSEVEQELKQFETLEEDLEKLQRDLLESEKRYRELALSLSASRKKLASLYEKKIESVLHELNMTATRFIIQVMQDKSQFSQDGMDKVSMLISANTGEEPKPLAKIASGGELSRVMLAMKTMTAQKNEIPTMVFDEIDTGVSGRTAQIIAQKLWDIARFRQVICVTHLHQLASMANSQFLVSKEEKDARTSAEVRLLKEDERVVEIAKMLGDLDTQGDSSLNHASVLLKDGAAYRAKLPGI